jgi:serine/threonine protein kinase
MNDLASSAARANAIAEQLIRDRVISHRPVHEALSDVSATSSSRDFRATLSASGRQLDVAASMLAVLRAPALFDRFRNDVLTRRAVTHANVVAYVNTFVGTLPAHADSSLASQPRLWICTEHMQLGSLEHLVDVQRLAFAEPHVAAVVRAVLAALDYLHSTHQIVHRCVGPDVVLVNDAGVVKLTDFALAADLTQSRGPPLPLPRDTRSSKRAFWLAPEVADEKATYCERSDVFSCALLVYAMLDGASPLAHLQPAAAIDALKRARTTGQLPFALRSPASPLLASFVEAGTRVLPDVRPSAQSLLRHSFLREAAPNDALLQWLKSGVQRQ